MRFFAFALILVLSTPLNAQMQRVDGALAPSDPTIVGRGHSKTHDLNVQENMHLQVRLRSGDFDAYLIMISPDGLHRWEDDDGLEYTDALVEMVTPTSGRYQVIVTSFSRGEVGEYTLEWSSTPIDPANAVLLRAQLVEASVVGTEFQRTGLASAIGETFRGRAAVVDDELRTRIEKARNDRLIIVKEAREHMTKLTVAVPAVDLSLSNLRTGMDIGVAASPFVDITFTSHYDKWVRYADVAPVVTGLLGLAVSSKMDWSALEGSIGGLTVGTSIAGLVRLLQGETQHQTAERLAGTSIGRGLTAFQRVTQLLAFNRDVYSDVQRLKVRLDSARVMDRTLEQDVQQFRAAHSGFWTASDADVMNNALYETFIDSVAAYSERFDRKASAAEAILTQARDMFVAYTNHPDYQDASDVATGTVAADTSVQRVAASVRNAITDFRQSYAQSANDWQRFRDVVALTPALRRRFVQFRNVGDLIAMLVPEGQR